MPSEIVDGYLLVRAVGDHDLESGFRDMMVAMDKAKAEYERTGNKVVMLLDMHESQEQRGTEDVRQISDFFKQFLGFLDGRIAIIVGKQVLFGVARKFAALTEQAGLDIRPYYDRAEALAFIGVKEQDVG